VLLHTVFFLVPNRRFTGALPDATMLPGGAADRRRVAVGRSPPLPEVEDTEAPMKTAGEDRNLGPARCPPLRF